MDSDYHPQNEDNKDAESKSSSQIYPAPISEETKALVQQVDPRRGRCLVTNLHPDRAVGYTHCVPRWLARGKDLPTSIEWYWGMEYDTLYLDTRYNIFPCCADLLSLHDKLSWMLVPEEHVVEQFYDSLTVVGNKRCAERGRFPTFEETVFKYRLIPILDKMIHMPIVYQDVVPPDHETPSPDNFTIHLYPYPNLPLLTSHLHPKFVIFEAGRKLTLLPPADLLDFVQEHPILEKIARIYTAWIRPIPSGAMDDRNFNPSPPVVADDWNKTPPRPAPKPRVAPAVWDNVTPPRPRPHRLPASSDGDISPVYQGEDSGSKRRRVRY